MITRHLPSTPLAVLGRPVVTMAWIAAGDICVEDGYGTTNLRADESVMYTIFERSTTEEAYTRFLKVALQFQAVYRKAHNMADPAEVGIYPSGEIQRRADFERFAAEGNSVVGVVKFRAPGALQIDMHGFTYHLAAGDELMLTITPDTDVLGALVTFGSLLQRFRQAYQDQTAPQRIPDAMLQPTVNAT